MLSKITTFFHNFHAGSIDKTSELSLEISATVLLCEVMLADGKLAREERQQLTKLISRQFNLTSAEVEETIEQALTLCENATDFYQFTSIVNNSYDLQQRIKMLELLWHIAYADGQLSSIEEHTIRKIADLLHLRHTEYIHTKLKAQTNENN